MMNAIPELTIVATSRNDDHGGNLLNRMQLFVNGLLLQCKRYELKAELILVEWNPPPDKPRLAEVLSWPVDSGPYEIRIIEVPPEIHKRFKYSEQLPLFQMIAKNVGIRRARGRFILATNVDILFSEELVRFLASGRLKKGRMYRVDRCDVPANIPRDVTFDELLKYCRQNVIRLYVREGICNLQTGEYLEAYPKLTLRRWFREKLQDWRLRPVTTQSYVHINGCGDFTLMDRESWMKLRGYPEFEMYSFDLDSVLCYAAYHSGMREQILQQPMVIYHIDHAIGSGWSPDGDQALHTRLEEIGVPRLPPGQMGAWAIKMRREHKPLIFNDINWGIETEILPETKVY